MHDYIKLVFCTVLKSKGPWWIYKMPNILNNKNTIFSNVPDKQMMYENVVPSTCRSAKCT